jgi:hypothetical protein
MDGLETVKFLYLQPVSCITFGVFRITFGVFHNTLGEFQNTLGVLLNKASLFRNKAGLFWNKAGLFLPNIWKLHDFAVSLHHGKSVTEIPSRKFRDEK